MTSKIKAQEALKYPFSRDLFKPRVIPRDHKINV